MAGLITMAVTPNYGWPVPVATDFVKDGYEAIADLGDAIDATVFGLPAGALTHINTTSFSAVASQSINDVFSATYKNYKILVNCTGTGGVALSLRYRVGGADNSTANYNWCQVAMGSSSTAITGTVGSSQTSASIGFAYGTGNGQEINVFNPFEATATLQETFQSSLTGGLQVTRLVGAGLNLSTSFDGFTIFPASGTITGTIRVYGVQD
jgi:hypothetical protein